MCFCEFGTCYPSVCVTYFVVNEKKCNGQNKFCSKYVVVISLFSHFFQDSFKMSTFDKEFCGDELFAKVTGLQGPLETEFVNNTTKEEQVDVGNQLITEDLDSVFIKREFDIKDEPLEDTEIEEQNYSNFPEIEPKEEQVDQSEINLFKVPATCEPEDIK